MYVHASSPCPFAHVDDIFTKVSQNVEPFVKEGIKNFQKIEGVGNKRASYTTREKVNRDRPVFVTRGAPCATGK
jgi:hypothetical protein